MSTAGNPINDYVTFVLYAVTGKLWEADELMKQRREQILEVARHMDWLHSDMERKRLYRGVLLCQTDAFGSKPAIKSGKLYPLDGVTFESWTEDKDVASWFADPKSVISEYVGIVRGYGFTLEREHNRHEILWHHSWRKVWFGDDETTLDLHRCARLHPHIAPVARQFDWNVKTQSEVIMLPSTEGIEVTSCLNSHPETEELNRKFAPPNHILEGGTA